MLPVCIAVRQAAVYAVSASLVHTAVCRVKQYVYRVVLASMLVQQPTLNVPHVHRVDLSHSPSNHYVKPALLVASRMQRVNHSVQHVLLVHIQQ